jgi:hypothetical protein
VQDGLLPLMLDDRWEPDCLFFVFEEDFRFSEYKYKLDASSARASDQRPASSSAAEPAAGGSSGSAAPRPAAEPAASSSSDRRSAVPFTRGQQSRLEGKTFALPSKPLPEDFRGMSVFLQDLVAMCTAAHRQRHGSLVWLSWQPCGPGQKPRSVYRVSSGSTAIAISRFGAAEMLKAFTHAVELKKPGHIDLLLKKWLSKNPAFGSSYIWPPVGGYTAHVSGCSHEHLSSVRPDVFKEPWFCPGTRREHDPQHREKWLCTFTVNSGCHYLVAFDVTDEDLDWKTGWEGSYDRPKSGDPATYPEHLDTDGEPGEQRTLTKRQKRALRGNRHLDQHRIWVEPTKAGRALDVARVAEPTASRFVHFSGNMSQEASGNASTPKPNHM